MFFTKKKTRFSEIALELEWELENDCLSLARQARCHDDWDGFITERNVSHLITSEELHMRVHIRGRVDR